MKDEFYKHGYIYKDYNEYLECNVTQHFDTFKGKYNTVVSMIILDGRGLEYQILSESFKERLELIGHKNDYPELYI